MLIFFIQVETVNYPCAVIIINLVIGKSGCPARGTIKFAIFAFNQATNRVKTINEIKIVQSY
jgi:hypothetical protein